MIEVVDESLHGLKVLEIGGGDCRLAGAVHVDPGKPPAIPAMWGAEPLPFADESFDLVYSSHCLEHIPFHRTHTALTEASRVLRPGGRIELWVPDFAYLVRCYHAKTGHEDGWIAPEEHQGDPMYWLNARVFSGREEYANDPLQVHRSLFDAAYLGRCLLRAGFVEPRRLSKTRTRDHYAINLGMGATKP